MSVDVYDPTKAIIVNLRYKEPYFLYRWYNAKHKQKKRKFKMSDYGGVRREAYKAARAFRKLMSSQVLRQRRSEGHSEARITKSLHADGMVGTVTFIDKEWYYEVRGNDGEHKQWTRNFVVSRNTKAEREKQHRRAMGLVQSMRDKPPGTIPPRVKNETSLSRRRRGGKRNDTDESEESE